ncbi:MAG: hypothetical protein LC642_05285 [Verrucomicrobiaceae bacterium]|nr:hypothetical protein [Verrucomicrobiaceae bacterium]
MSQPNMNKEYRAELKSLRKNRGHVLRDWKSFVQSRRGMLRTIEREVNGVERKVKRNLGRFDKRIAILEGRLS